VPFQAAKRKYNMTTIWVYGMRGRLFDPTKGFAPVTGGARPDVTGQDITPRKAPDGNTPGRRSPILLISRGCGGVTGRPIGVAYCLGRIPCKTPNPDPSQCQLIHYGPFRFRARARKPLIRRVAKLG